MNIMNIITQSFTLSVALGVVLRGRGGDDCCGDRRCLLCRRRLCWRRRRCRTEGGSSSASSATVRFWRKTEKKWNREGKKKKRERESAVQLGGGNMWEKFFTKMQKIMVMVPVHKFYSGNKKYLTSSRNFFSRIADTWWSYFLNRCYNNWLHCQIFSSQDRRIFFGHRVVSDSAGGRRWKEKKKGNERYRSVWVIDDTLDHFFKLH